ncbi:MAG TPA: response regulator [Gemmatimonadaceae bacterium]|nr:response regulator [Gemmatimonadaceae bacterium]
MISPGSPHEALVVLDTKLTVRAANQAFYSMFRVAPEECVGHKVYEVGGRSWDTKLKPMLEAVLHGAPQSDHFELIHDGKPGGQAVHWLTARLVPSADADDATILLAIEDLSTGGSAEENLALRTQELNNFADLAGRSAHELNNMLTVIRMNADLIEGTLNQAKLSAGEAVDIRNAADRAEILTKKLLLASRRTLPQPTGLDRGAVTVPLPGSPLKESQEEVAARESLEAQAGRVGRLKHGRATGKETILLVDDEKALRKLGKRVLSQAGYRVLEASDGAMALRIAAEEVGEIDLVLTDIEMPTLGGRGMVDELHEMSPEIRVLFMSGYTDNEILRRGIRTSETDFLQKPFTAESLCAAVRSVLEKPATPSS